jgi:hypothetical protein
MGDVTKQSATQKSTKTPKTKTKINKNDELGKVMNQDMHNEATMEKEVEIGNEEITENEGAQDEIVHEEEKQQELMNFDGNQPLRRSSRVRTPTRRMLESMTQETMSLPISLQIMKKVWKVKTF